MTAGGWRGYVLIAAALLALAGVVVVQAYIGEVDHYAIYEVHQHRGTFEWHTAQLHDAETVWPAVAWSFDIGTTPGLYEARAQFQAPATDGPGTLIVACEATGTGEWYVEGMPGVEGITRLDTFHITSSGADAVRYHVEDPAGWAIPSREQIYLGVKAWTGDGNVSGQCTGTWTPDTPELPTDTPDPNVMGYTWEHYECPGGREACTAQADDTVETTGGFAHLSDSADGSLGVWVLRPHIEFYSGAQVDCDISGSAGAWQTTGDGGDTYTEFGWLRDGFGTASLFERVRVSCEPDCETADIDATTGIGIGTYGYSGALGYDCQVTWFDSEGEPGTTPTPPGPTVTPAPTYDWGTPAAFSTRAPWSTPVPGEDGTRVGLTPGEATCLTLVPALDWEGEILGVPVDIPFEGLQLCLQNMTLELELFGIDIGAWVVLMVMVGAAGVLYTVIRQ